MTSTLDAALRALAHPERRRILVALAEHDPPSDEVLDVPEDAPGETAAEKRRIDLYHVHLPTLEAAGLVRWDRESHRVTRGSQFDEIRPVLELLTDDPDQLAPDV